MTGIARLVSESVITRPRTKRDLHHAEVVGRDASSARRMDCRQDWPAPRAFDVKAPAVAIAAHRNLAGDRRALHAGKRAQPLEQAILKATTAAFSRYAVPPGENWKVSTFRASNPGFVWTMCRDGAKHEARACQQHQRERDVRNDEDVARMRIDADVVRRSFPSAAPGRGDDTRSAGKRPKTMPVASDSPSANASTGSIDAHGARSRKRHGRNLPEAAQERPPPARFPARRRAGSDMVLSVSIWRTSRARLAPSAARTAISRDRFIARASSRLATFAHAISSTKADGTKKNQQRRANGTCQRSSESATTPTSPPG